VPLSKTNLHRRRKLNEHATIEGNQASVKTKQNMKTSEMIFAPSWTEIKTALKMKGEL
jgi:hypothetical protein